MEPFCNIIKRAIIAYKGPVVMVQTSFMQSGPKVLHPAIFYAAATETMLLDSLKKTLLSFQT